MDRGTITVRKLDMNSTDFEEANMSICYGSPQECWDEFWAFVPVTSMFSKHGPDFSKPVQRNIAKKIYRPVGVAI